MAETTVKLVTTGMHCGSCAMLIDMTLKDVPGVIRSRADHADGATTVTYDDAIVDVSAIIDAIRSAGYEAELPA